MPNGNVLWKQLVFHFVVVVVVVVTLFCSCMRVDVSRHFLTVYVVLVSFEYSYWTTAYTAEIQAVKTVSVYMYVCMCVYQYLVFGQ